MTSKCKRSGVRLEQSDALKRPYPLIMSAVGSLTLRRGGPGLLFPSA